MRLIFKVEIILRRWTRFVEENALAASLLVLVGYILYFTVPALVAGNAFGNSISGATVEGMTSTLWPEIRLVVSVVVVITLLGWWGRVGMVLPHGEHWVRPVFFAYLLTLLLLIIVVVTLSSSDLGMLPLALIGTIFGTALLVGLFEELLFRGIVLQGLSSALGPVAAVIMTSVLFGAMHLVNWVNGQTLGATVTQCIHAAAAGLLYGALVLRTGSLWPSILLHGLWDGTITLFSAISPDDAAAAETTGDTVFTALFFGYEPVLAIIILLVWGMHHRHDLGRISP